MMAVLVPPFIESDATTIHTKHEPASTRITLFEVISALQEAAGPDDDASVVEATIDMLQSGCIRFLDEAV
jgi:hypothetical protein